MATPLLRRQLNRLFFQPGYSEGRFEYLFQAPSSACTLHLMFLWERGHKNGKHTAGISFSFTADVIAPVMEYEVPCVFDETFTKYVTWLLEFIYWLIQNLANAPGPYGDRREMEMATARLPCLLLGAAGHNREEAVERQPLARTQGRNLDRSLTFKRRV